MTQNETNVRYDSADIRAGTHKTVSEIIWDSGITSEVGTVVFKTCETVHLGQEFSACLD